MAKLFRADRYIINLDYVTYASVSPEKILVYVREAAEAIELTGDDAKRFIEACDDSMRPSSEVVEGVKTF